MAAVMRNNEREGDAGLPLASSGRWFAVILLRYNTHDPFWDRDAGLFFEGFKANGIDTRFVALGDPYEDENRGLVLAPQNQMEDPAWWRQWGLEGIVLYSWALPRFTGVVRAAKQAGLKVVLPLDGDGTRSPREWFSRTLLIKYIYAKMHGQWLPWAVAAAKTLGGLPRWRYTGALEHMSLVDYLGAQSPLAKQRFTRFLEGCGRADLAQKLVPLHHPIGTHMVYDPSITKQPLIVAVGGWERLVKGAPLLVEVLGMVLEREPHYRARIIGTGEEHLRSLSAKLPSNVRERLEIAGPVPNQRVSRHYQEAQIIVNTSYSEGFSLAMAEALCCGCSVVGSALMSCMNYFCADGSGTLACKRSADFFCDAVRAEVDAWTSGQRDPVRISRIWIARLHADRVARQVLQLARG
jgi:glycosyltransferase involved in cell wall biosynthesis